MQPDPVQPLDGVRVLDFSQYAPGPFVTRTLCDLGASVIKIEPPNGDPMSRLFLSRSGEAAVYQALNHGKQIARIDLKSSQVVEDVKVLLGEADVLIEGFRPGVMDRLGLGFETCSSVAPALVYCALTGYGQNGPYAMKAGHDINYCAAAGAFSYATAPSLFPLVGDHSGAQNAVGLVLAALVASIRTGAGRYLDVSLYEPMLGWQYLNQSPDESVENPLALLWGDAACYNLYTTADQRAVTLGALESTFWRNFCEAMNRPDWIERQHEPMPQAALIQEVRELFGGHPLSHWNDVLGEIDCCFEPVPLTGEIFSHPQTTARALFSPGRTGIAEPSLSAGASDVTHGDLSISTDCPTWIPA